MKKLILIISTGLCFACEFAPGNEEQAPVETEQTQENSEEQIDLVLENWHAAAANANFDEYFGLMTENGVFIGTDATENWQNKEFREYAKPHFDNGKAWSFSTLERNIYTSKNGETAWFDELLDTQMGVCRGSGVLENQDGKWKITHYVLSIAIPNENTSEITELKKEFDSTFIGSYSNKISLE